jgi:hypothetical protein
MLLLLLLLSMLHPPQMLKLMQLPTHLAVGTRSRMQTPQHTPLVVTASLMPMPLPLQIHGEAGALLRPMHLRNHLAGVNPLRVSADTTACQYCWYLARDVGLLEHVVVLPSKSDRLAVMLLLLHNSRVKTRVESTWCTYR